MKALPVLRLSAGTIIAPLILSLSSCSSDKKQSVRGDQVPDIDVAEAIVDSVTLHKTYPGYIEAQQAVDIVARVNGNVIGKYFEDGKWVKKGTLLYSIEPNQYADAVNQAKASLATAEASYNYAANQYKAMKKALESDAVSQMDVLQAKATMDESAAAIQSARAALSSAATRLGYCSIRAPFDGRVAAGSVIPGNYVAGEGSPVTLTRIINDEAFNVNFSVEDAQYLLMVDKAAHKQVDLDKVPVEFTDTLPHSYFGSLNYSDPVIDTSTGTMKLRLHLDNPWQELKSGMYCVVHLPYAVEDEAILVNDASIGTDQLGKYLYTVNDSNQVRYTSIEVGELVNDTMRIVNKGITPGTRYVTKALLKVRDGMKINPVEAKSR